MEGKESEIIRRTQNFWKEYYNVELSLEDTREAVQNIAGFFKILKEWKDKAS